jgi:hypothetical protein
LKLTLALCKLPHDAKLFLEKSENDEFREGALLPVSNVKRSRCRARAVPIWGGETCSVTEQAPTSSTYSFVHACTDVVPDDSINRSFVSSKCEREAGSRFNVKLVATCQFVSLPRTTTPCLMLEQPVLVHASILVLLPEPEGVNM